MGFWYYCLEKCCGASAYKWAGGLTAELDQFAGSQNSKDTYQPSEPPGTVDFRPPLKGRPPAIERQSDGWVLIRDNYGIRDDGSLWGDVTGSGKMLPLDDGPWVWVSPDPTTNGAAGVGIKADGTLWSWNLPVPGDGSIGLWSMTTKDTSLRVHIDQKMTGVSGLRSQNGEFSWQEEYSESLGGRTFSLNGLGATLWDCEPNTGSGLTAEVSDISLSGGGSGYLSPPTVTVTPSGATGTAILGTRAGWTTRVIEVKVDSRGTYNYKPTISFTGTANTPAAARAFLQLDKASAQKAFTAAIEDASVYYVEVTNGGSNYTHPPTASFDPPSASAEAVLTDSGSVGFIKVTSGGAYATTPTVTITNHPSDITGSGCTATAHVEGLISSITIQDQGSYTQPYAAFDRNDNLFKAWSDPPQCVGHICGVKLNATGSNYLAPIPPDVKIVGDGVGATATAAVDAQGVVTAVTVVNPGSKYTTEPSVVFDPPGAVATATVSNGQVTAINVVTGGAYIRPSPPTVTLDSKNGSGAQIKATVNSTGAVTGLAIYSAGTGYDAPDYTNAKPEIKLIFTPTVPGVGSGASGVAYVISKYRHAIDYRHELYQGKDYVGSFDMRMTVAEAVMSSGGIHSIDQPAEPLTIAQEGRGFALGWGRGPADTRFDSIGSKVKEWRIAGGTGKLMPAYAEPVAVPLESGIWSSGGATAAYSIAFSGEVAGSQVTLNPLKVHRVIIPLPSTGSGYSSPPTVTFTGSGAGGAAAQATIQGGSVVAVTVTSPGQYDQTPTVTFSAPEDPGGSKAIGYATTFTHYEVYQLTVTEGGSGYTRAPSLACDPPPNGYEYTGFQSGTFVSVSNGSVLVGSSQNFYGIYPSLPTVTVVRASKDAFGPADTTGTGAVAVPVWRPITLRASYPAADGLDARPSAVHRVLRKHDDLDVTLASTITKKCDGVFVTTPNYQGLDNPSNIFEIPPASKASKIEALPVPESVGYTPAEVAIAKSDNLFGVVPTKLGSAAQLPFSYDEFLSHKVSLTCDWYTHAVANVRAPGEFRQKTAPMPTLCAAAPYTSSETLTSTPEINVVLQASGDYAAVTSFKLTAGKGGGGFLYEPYIDYSPNPYGLTFDLRQVGAGKGWTNAEALYNCCVAIKDGQLYWWGSVDFGDPAAENLFPRRQCGLLAYPVRVGNSAVIKATNLPSGTIRNPLPPSVEVSPPQAGWGVPSISTINPPQLGTIVTGMLESPYTYHTSTYLDTAAIASTGSVGYTSAPSVSAVGYDGSNPFGISAELRGPDGTASRIIPMNTQNNDNATPTLFAVLCNDGSLWYWRRTAAPILATNTTAITTGPPFSQKVTICDKVAASAYIATTLTQGSGYTTAPGADITISSPVLIPGKTTSTLTPCGDGFITEDVPSCPTVTYATSVLPNPTDGSPLTINTTIDETGAVISSPGYLFYSAQAPSFSYAGSGSGSGWSLDATKLTTPICPGGWERIGKISGETFSHFHAEAFGGNQSYDDLQFSESVAVTKQGSPRRHIRWLDSAPAPTGLSNTVSLSVTGRAAWEQDGTLLATNSVDVRIQGNLELNLQNGGGGLRHPPLAELKSQLAGVATATAKIDGKVVAFGVTTHGSGYSKQPLVSLKSVDAGGFSGGSGAAGTAHICGPVDSVTVSNAGTGYRVAPAVTFSRPGMPAKATTTVVGVVDSISVTDPGSNYSEPPEVFIFASDGGGAGATATATIKGIVDSIYITKSGSGYSKSPDVTISGGGGAGAKAVATVAGGSVIDVTLTAAGSGYTQPPTITIASPESGGVPATAVAFIRGGVDSITVKTSGSGYRVPPSVAFSGGKAKAAASVSLGVDAAAVQSGGRYWNTAPTIKVTPDSTVNSIALGSGGTGYTTTPSVLLVGGTGTGAAAAARISGTVTAMSVTSKGSGYSKDFPPYVFISGGLDQTVGRNATAAVTISAIGELDSVTLADKGAGYNSTPQVTLGWPLQATAVASISGGKVSEVQVVNKGAFYMAPPTVKFAGGGGSGAAAAAIIEEGSVSSITISEGGDGYTSPPEVTLWYDTSGTGGEVAATISASVTGVTVSSRGSGYRIAPQVLFIGGGGAGAAATAAAGGQGQGATLECKINGAVEYIELTNNGSGYQFPPAVTIDAPDMTPGQQAAAQARILGKVSSYEITNGGSGYRGEVDEWGEELGALVPALVHGVGYVPGDGPHPGSGYSIQRDDVFFGATAGVVTDPAGAPPTYYVQPPAVTFQNAIGVRAMASMQIAGLGVDHIGKAGTGSSKPSLTAAWPLQMIKSTVGNWAAQGVPFESTTSALAHPVITRQVWRGVLSPFTGSTTSGSFRFTKMAATPLPAVYLENEKGKNATVSIVGDLTTGKSSFSVSGGQDYLARYNDGDPIVTLEGATPLPIVSPATATTTIDGSGAVNSLALTSGGAGYIAPKAYIHGGGGAGAEATLIASNGVITQILLTKAGSGYVAPPSVAIVETQPIAATQTLTAVAGAMSAPHGILLQASGATLDFVELFSRGQPFDMESLADMTARAYKSHVFYDNGYVVDARFVHQDESRWSKAFAKRHTTPPEFKFTAHHGTACTATATIVKWHAPVSDGAAIRDTTP